VACGCSCCNLWRVVCLAACWQVRCTRSKGVVRRLEGSGAAVWIPTVLAWLMAAQAECPAYHASARPHLLVSTTPATLSILAARRPATMKSACSSGSRGGKHVYP
jgi:hypothetical protein